MRTVLVLGLLLALSACVGPADRSRLGEEQQTTDVLAPSFSPLPANKVTGQEEPDPATGDGPSPVEGSPPAPDDPAPVPRDPPAPPTSGASASSPSSPTRPGVARLDDPPGDVTGLDPPDWADLRRARLVGDDSTFILTHTADDAFPDQGDGTDTMNIATFFDVDGDGAIDYEIWVNLSPEGWGTSYFDEREGTARYAAEDDVDVEVVDGDVVLRFPASHLAQAPSFRWSIASEYGPYEAIGTDAMARDYLPDDRSGRPFPD